MANHPGPVFKYQGVPVWFRIHHIFQYNTEWLQSQHYESSDYTPPHTTGSPPPLCIAGEPSPFWKRTLVWLKYHTYVIKQRKNCMV
jgi:hypothetical protein